MIAERAALDAAQMAALVIIRERQMGDAAGFPEPNGVAPLGLLAGGGDAGVDADRRRIAAGLLGHMAQSVERGARLLARSVRQWHPAIAPFDGAPQRDLRMSAVPERHLARGRSRVDPGILDRVPLAFEGDMRLLPQRPHEFDLLLRAAAAIVKILVEAGEFDLVPADPDTEPEPPARQYIEACRLLRDERGLALRQDQHLRRKILDFRDRGEKPEQHEGIVVEVG